MLEMSPEILHASAIQFLIDGKEKKAAELLLSCTLTHINTHTEAETRYKMSTSEPYTTPVLVVDITLSAPPITYDTLCDVFGLSWPIVEDEERRIASSIKDAFSALLPPDTTLGEIHICAALVEINPQWKEEFHAILQRTGIHNQGVQFSEEQPVHMWKNLRFRSQTEIRVVEALDRAGVLFLPNCRARLGFKTRENREADLLVCCDGKWGILEIDSERFHKSAADDHERDRLFKAHGIAVIEHFDQGECWENADGVVKKFLYLLRKQNR